MDNVEEMARFDVVRLTEITDDEYEYMKAHPRSRKDGISLVNTAGLDFSLVPRFARKMRDGKYEKAVVKERLVWGFYERGGGVLDRVFRSSLEELYGEPSADTYYPVNRRVASILEAIGLDVHMAPDSVVCVVFRYSDKYARVQE